MKSILNIFIILSDLLLNGKMQVEINSASWLATGAIIAFLLLVYLVISLFKSEKF
jgi:K+-transporting ATPase KdpF subunit